MANRISPYHRRRWARRVSDAKHIAGVVGGKPMLYRPFVYRMAAELDNVASAYVYDAAMLLGAIRTGVASRYPRHGRA